MLKFTKPCYNKVNTLLEGYQLLLLHFGILVVEFIVGVNDSGIIDGGIPRSKGKQSIRDWADNAIKLTALIYILNLVFFGHLI